MKRTKYLALIGSKNSGKTRFLERIIPLLSKKDKRVACIKVAANKVKFDFDKYEFDVERQLKAGSESVIFLSPISTSITHNRRMTIQSALETLKDFDYVFIEAQKEDIKRFPILMFIKYQEEIQIMDSEYVIAISSLDENISVSDHRYMDFDNLEKNLDKIALEQLAQLNCGHCGYDNCDEMLKAIINGSGSINDCEPLQDQTWSFDLKVNGKPVPCVNFIQDIFRDAFLAAIKTLKGIDSEISEVEWNFKRNL